MLLYGPPGLGKTTLACVIANELGVPIRSTAGPVIEKPGDLAAILTNLQEREVLFIDEVHRMSPAIEEILYPAMEDYELDIMIGQGPSARSVKVPVQRFTLIGATTRTGPADRSAPLAVRHRAPAGFLRRRRHPRDRAAVGADHRRADRPRRVGRDRAAVAGHAARGEPAAAAGARLRAGARQRAHHASTSRCARSGCSRSTSTASTRSIAGCCARSSTSSTAARSAWRASPRR